MQTDEALFEPILTCDEPEEGSIVTRGTVMSGWAYSPAGIREVSIWLDGQRVGEAIRGLERPDVAQAHPEWPNALHSGFRYRLKIAPVTVDVENAQLVVVAEDEEGRRTEERRVVRRDPRDLLKEKLKSTKKKLKARNRELKGNTQKQYETTSKALVEKDWAELLEHRKWRKSVQQEIFELERRLHALEKGGVESEPVTGALPDFVVIGGQKCGTTFFYDLLTQHAFVEPAASKELHFFDLVFELGVEWYSRCFPAPRWKDGRRTITGEATPYYLFHPHAARRMAEVVPRARLIALLRNPIDRAYSMYYQQVSKGYETLEFEEAIEAEEARLHGEEARLLEDEHYASFALQNFSYLSRGIYIDQLLRWSEFFPKEQMLVLKSEDLFESSRETLNTVLEFLDLPNWDFQALLVPMIPNKGEYEKMNPSTRRRLEEYFEPHNERLYEFLGRDFGW